MKADINSRWDWLAAVLLVAAIFIAAVRLNATNWTPDLGYVDLLSVLGTVLGLALGYSRFRRPALRWLVFGYTIVIVPAQLCRLIVGEKTAIGQLASLGGRFVASFGSLFSGKPIEDHLFFVTLMVVLFWAIGIYSGYRLVRDSAILAVLLPSTLPILIIQYYDGFKPDRIWGLALYFFTALLLVGRINLLNARQRWEEQNIVAGNDPEFDLNRYIIVAATVIILLAWMLPAPAAVLPAAASAWRTLTHPFDSTRERINNMLAALQSTGRVGPSTEFYGPVMGLGRNAGSGPNELFTVRAPQNDLPRLYWRMRTYDTYENGNWQAANSQKTPFGPDQGSLVRDDVMSAPTGEFIFNWKTNQSSLLVTPSLPVWSSRTGSIQIMTRGDLDYIDPLSWSVSPYIQNGDQYQVRSLMINPSRKQLREAGSEYPQAITEYYMQVPENIFDDLNRLAAQITSGKTSSFDKAEAITEYLRQNIRYSDTIPAPPPGMDPLSWFLFTWKSGFCNYYATAEVLLLRSQGIPARLVVGYSQGIKGNYGSYTVLGTNAHAWPEVYFPGIGWVEFEPTVTQQAIVRRTGDEPVGGANNDPLLRSLDDPANGDYPHNPLLDEPQDVSGTDRGLFGWLARATWLWVIISLVAILAVGFGAWELHRRQPLTRRAPLAVRAIYTRYHIKSPPWLDHWVRWSEVSHAERAFHAINQSLAWLKRPQPVHVTPAERAQLLKILVPDAVQQIDWLSSSLEQTMYSPVPADPSEAGRMAWMIRFFTVRTIILSRFFAQKKVER